MKLMVGVARFLLLCAVVLVIPALAAAQVSVTLQPNQGPVNTGVTATGTGWPAGTAVYIYFESQLIGGPVTPDTGGAFTTTFCVPDRQPGVYPVFFTNGRENFAPPFTITAGGPGNCQITALPDLIPTAIQYNSADLVPGGTVTFDSGIQNAGAQGTGVFNIKWFVDGVEVGYGSHGGVPANSTVSDGNSQFWWVVTTGTHTITFTVDADNHVAESNESNNSRSVRVTSSDIDVVWAGYAAAGAEGSLINFTKIEASWTVQPITCSLLETSRSTYWVGLGGTFAGAGLEQIGTASGCFAGFPLYWGIWQIIVDKDQGAKPIDPIFHHVYPNNRMEASVEVISKGQYRLTLHNITVGWTWSKDVAGSTKEAAVQTAECIVELPPGWTAAGLSDFGVFTFAGCNADDMSLLTYPRLLQFTMTKGGAILAEPSAISPDSDFNVTWRHE